MPDGSIVENRLFNIEDLIVEMVALPAGAFLMGSPDDGLDQHQNESPLTTVTISQPFWMSKYEVTQGQYRELVGDNPSAFAGINAPIEQVSWNDAVEFCQILTERERAVGRLLAGHEYRLPTEAQWEYACRAGTTIRFSYGDDAGYTELSKYAWYGSNSASTTHHVGGKLANPWGLHDMHGNVWEWCLDKYENYPGGEQVDPTRLTGSLRVIRGGSWSNLDKACRSASRNSGAPTSRGSRLGFRPVLVSVQE